MREPAWNKRISICSLSHAAILNVWSSHCPRAISPRQRRTRNHQPVPTLTPKVDSERRSRSRYHVAIKHAQRSASCPCRRHGGHFSDSKAPRRAASRTSGTSAAPGGCTAGGSCAARGTRPSRGRPAHRRAACGAAGTARSTAPGHRRAADGATSTSRRATATRASFRRARTGRRRTTGPDRTWAEGTDGRRSDARETAWEVEAEPILPSPRCANVRDVSPRSPRNVRATLGRATAGSIRSYRAGPEQLRPARPRLLQPANLQPNRRRPHLAQRGFSQSSRRPRA